MNRISSVTIARIGNCRTVKYAAEELRKYLKKLDSKAIVDIRIYDEYDGNRKNFLWIGLSDEFASMLPSVSDKTLDDAIYVDVTDFGGVITGTNERSVLIAAYRFLHELGIDWVRPGVNGEIIRKKSLDKCSVNVCEAASYRHRAICLEGAVSQEHIYETIDWMPKVGMNGFFTQFHSPVGFYAHWYTHERNPYLKGEEFTREDADRILAKTNEDMTDRSLIYYTVGHGWTCEPFGIEGASWAEVSEEDTPDDVREMLAMRDGKRGWNNGVPANTNICLSNKKAVDIIADSIVKYCNEHPEATYPIIWLADLRNNYCECEKCKNSTPADLYVAALNRIDEVLTEHGIDRKLVYFSANETSWVPKTVKFNNPDRFLLQFAPITRRFDEGEAYADIEDLDALEPVPIFELNKLIMPRTAKPIVRMMREWLDYFKGDSCVYDYHLWTTTIDCDPGGMSIAETVFRDMCALKRIGINGMVSCQVERAYFPNALPMQLMADALWNHKADYETLVEKHLTDCYGSQWKTAKAYLGKLSEIATYWPHWDEKDVVVDEKRVADFKEALVHIANYKPIIEKIAADGGFEFEVQQFYWNALIIHLEIARLICEMQIKKFSGKSKLERADAERALSEYLCKTEPELHEVFDAWRQMLGLAVPGEVENAH